MSRITVPLVTTMMTLAVAHGQPHAVSGRLELYGAQGIGPAASVRVSLASNTDTLGPAVTDMDGAFVIGGAAPGTHILLVWAEVQNKAGAVQMNLLSGKWRGAPPQAGSKSPPKSGQVKTTKAPEPQRFRIEVRTEPVTSLRPILINRFRFQEPASGSRHAAGAVITASGVHSFPSSAQILILPVLADGKYLIRDLGVNVGDDSTWTREGIVLEAGFEALSAVLMTAEAAARLRALAQAGGQLSLENLPAASRVLAMRKLEVEP